MDEYVIGMLDDNVVFLENTKRELLSIMSTLACLPKVLAYSDAEDFLKAYRCGKIQCDLYILDVRMPGTDGFAVAQEIREKEKDAQILFLTEYPGEAIHGYDVRARHFFVKETSLIKLRTFLPTLYREWRDAGSRFYLYQYDGKIRKIYAKDIVYFEFDTPSNQLKICMKGEILRERKSLRKALDEFDSSGFAFVSRGCAVNLAWVASIDGNRVALKDGNAKEISRKYKKDFLAQVIDHMRSRS